MGSANTVCADWRWAQDTAARNWIENAHVDLSDPDSWLDTNLCIRWLLDNTGAKDEEDGYNLEYSVNAGPWVPVTTSTSYVKAVASSNFTDGDGTSQELGSGTFDEGYWDDDGNIASYILAQGEESEHEHCFQFISADCAGNTIRLQLAFDGGNDLDGYTYSAPSCVFTAASYTLAQPNWRLRSGDAYGLNVDNGWAAAINVGAALNAGSIVRARIEVEETDAGDTYTGTFKLQFRRKPYGGSYGSWIDVMNRAEIATSTEPLFCLNSNQFTDGDATTNLLSGSSRTFEAGEGSTNRTTNSSNALANEHTEHEFAFLMIGTWWDTGPQRAVDGDEIQLRLVESDDTVFTGAYSYPTITVAVPDYYMGHVMPEQHGTCGPFVDSNGKIYTPGESASTTGGYDLDLLGSSDGGKSWAWMDDANAPGTGDIEALDGQILGDTIHMVVQDGTGSGDVTYHTYRMSSHASPDTWDVTDEAVATPANVPADQGCGIGVRSDGDVIAVYRTNDSPNERVVYKIKPSGGSWGSETSVDTQSSTDFVFSGCVIGESDALYIFYRAGSNLYCKRLSSGDSLGSRKTVYTDAQTAHTEHWATNKPVYWEDGSSDDNVMILVQDATNEYIHSVVITNDGTPDSSKQITPNAIWEDRLGDRQPVSSMAIDPATDTVYVLMVYDSDEDLYRDEAVDDGGWGTDTSQESGITCDLISALVFTHSSGNGGDKVLGWIYSKELVEAETGGDEGFTWYDEHIIEAGAAADPIAALVGQLKKRKFQHMIVR